jgi:hypothetical protein
VLQKYIKKRAVTDDEEPNGMFDPFSRLHKALS